MTDRVGVALIGYSFMGKAHSNAWRNVGAFYPGLPQVRQQVLVGRDGDAVAAAAQRYGWADSASDWRDVVTREDVDIVDICTPGHLHAEIALAALAAGKHVLVEKPLANTVEEAERLVTAADRARAESGVQSMVGFNYRRVPALSLARSMIAAGEIGDVRQVRLAYLQDWLADAAAPMAWRLRAETAGTGALGDLGSHAVDQLQWLLADHVTTVSGSTATFVTERCGPRGPEQVTVDDAAWATLHTGRGTIASLEVSRVATARKNAFQIEVYGTGGSIRFDLERLNELLVATGSVNAAPRQLLVTDADHPYVANWWPPGHTLGWDHTFTSQAADLLADIAACRAPSPSFAEGLSVQRVLAAISTSARDDGTVQPVPHEIVPRP